VNSRLKACNFIAQGNALREKETQRKRRPVRAKE